MPQIQGEKLTCMDKSNREWLEECEARHRINQVRKHGRRWWLKEKKLIKKLRGEEGLKKIIKNMERLRSNV